MSEWGGLLQWDLLSRSMPEQGTLDQGTLCGERLVALEDF
jgi:hypothetical protein